MMALRMTYQELPLALPRASTEGVQVIAPGLARIIRSVIACSLHISASAPEVDDALQETLKRAAEKQRFDTPYVVGIAKYVALDALRLRVKTRKRETELPEAAGSGPLPAGSIDATTGESALEQKQLRGQLQSLIAALPENQRMAFIKRELDGESYEALASHFSVPMGTIATWLSRARATLAQGLQGNVDVATRPHSTSGASR
jgi:RNA polymerase sigma factor (sigma-70 family)